MMAREARCKKLNVIDRSDLVHRGRFPFVIHMLSQLPSNDDTMSDIDHPRASRGGDTSLGLNDFSLSLAIDIQPSPLLTPPIKNSIDSGEHSLTDDGDDEEVSQNLLRSSAISPFVPSNLPSASPLRLMRPDRTISKFIALQIRAFRWSYPEIYSTLESITYRSVQILRRNVILQVILGFIAVLFLLSLQDAYLHNQKHSLDLGNIQSLIDASDDSQNRVVLKILPNHNNSLEVSYDEKLLKTSQVRFRPFDSRSAELLCSFSDMGLGLSVDDSGRVCDSMDRLPNGCCPQASPAGPLSCSKCSSMMGCCPSPESCLSCCLHLLPPTETPQVSLDFLECEQRCHTSSHSIRHGNLYKYQSTSPLQYIQEKSISGKIFCYIDRDTLPDSRAPELTALVKEITTKEPERDRAVLNFNLPPPIEFKSLSYYWETYIRNRLNQNPADRIKVSQIPETKILDSIDLLNAVVLVAEKGVSCSQTCSHFDGFQSYSPFFPLRFRDIYFNRFPKDFTPWLQKEQDSTLAPNEHEKNWVYRITQMSDASQAFAFNPRAPQSKNLGRFQCVDSLLSIVNSCPLMNRFAQCAPEQCDAPPVHPHPQLNPITQVESEASSLPALLLRETPTAMSDSFLKQRMDFRPKASCRVSIQSRIFNCDASHPSFYRICPCIRFEDPEIY